MHTKSLDRKSWTSGTVLGPPILSNTIAVPLGPELEGSDGVTVARVRAGKLDGNLCEKKELGRTAFRESFRGIRVAILSCN